MTSTNDGKDVKSNQTSGQKGKSYYIELYKSLDAQLNSDCELSERVALLCNAWRRVHTLCLHSAPTTHPFLLSWIQRHTARTVLQSEWQSPKGKNEHVKLIEAFEAFCQECRDAAASRDGAASCESAALPWETQLQGRAEWFKGVVDSPWGHPVLKLLLDPTGQRPTTDEILEWLLEERGVVFAARLRQLALAKCDDLALSLLTAVMDRVRLDRPPTNDLALDEGNSPSSTKLDAVESKTDKSTFESVLNRDAGFSDVWDLLTDMELVLLHKSERNTRLIDLAKQTPLLNGYQLVERLINRLESSPKEKKIWKNAKDVALLVAQVMITRCMVVPQCVGEVRKVLYWCSRALVRVLPPRKLGSCTLVLAAPASTARHLHALAAAVHQQCAESEELKPFVVELYVRAITFGMNELEKLKLKPEYEAAEARSTEQTLSSWFIQLGQLLSGSARLRGECVLTAFSVHPSAQHYERIRRAPLLHTHDKDTCPIKDESETTENSWAMDSHSQTNFVKTSETLNIKKTQHSANVMSTAILNEGEALGLNPELCQDIIVLLSGPRVKTLSCDMDRETLLENCRAYMERTGGGTRAVTTELKYLNLDPRQYQHLPEEQDNEDDLYYGIEKGYEHLVEFEPQPEEIWEDAVDPEQTDTAESSYSDNERHGCKKKTKGLKSTSESDSDPLSLVAEHKRERAEKKERSNSIERNRSKETKKHEDTKKHNKHTHSQRKKKDKKERKKEKKERKKREKKEAQKPAPHSMSHLVGVKVTLVSPEEAKGLYVTDSDYDSQGKSSLQSEGNDEHVLYDGQFSTDVLKSPTKRSPEYTVNLNRELNAASSHITKALNRQTSGQRIYGNTTAQAKAAKSTSVQAEDPKAAKSSTVHAEAAKPVPQADSKMLSRDELKKNITKLIQFRKQKSVEAQSASDANPKPSTSLSSLIGTKLQNTTQFLLNNTQTERVASMKNEAMDFRHSILFPLAQPKQSPGTCSRTQPFHPARARQRLPSSQTAFDMSNLPQDPTILNNAMTQYSQMQANKSQVADESSESSHLSCYQDFLKELGRSSLSVSPLTEERRREMKPVSRVVPLVPKVKPDPVPTVSASPAPSASKPEPASVAPQCAKPNLPKKVESAPSNAPNTFARLSYMHKNKLNEKPKSDPNPTLHNSVSEELDRRIAELRMSKMALLMDKHETTLNSGNMPPKRELSKVEIQASEQPNTTKWNIRNEHPVLTNILRNNLGTTISVSSNAEPHTAQTEGRTLATKPKQSSLSEKDHQDILKLLGQKNRMQASPSDINIINTKNLNNTVSNKCISGSSKPLSVTKPVPSESFQQNQATNNEMIEIKARLPVNLGNTSFQFPVISNTTILKTTAMIQDSKVLPVQQVQLKQSKSKTKGKNTQKIKNHPRPQVPSTNVLEVKKEVSKKYVPKPPPPTPQFHDDVKEQDWAKVLDALRSQKTPNRGPSALDMTIKKDALKNFNVKNLTIKSPIAKKVENFISSVLEQQAAQQTKTSRHAPSQTPKSAGGTSKVEKMITSELQQRIAQQTKISQDTLRKENTKSTAASKMFQKQPSSGTEILKKPAKVENKKPKLSNSLMLSSDTTKQEIEPQLNKEDPFIAGIQNSDYDILEELLDDDLRQEIGELSSDEDKYDAAVMPIKGAKHVVHKNVHTVNIKNNAPSKQKLNPNLVVDKAQANQQLLTTMPQSAPQKEKLRILSNEKVDIRNFSSNIIPVIRKGPSALVNKPQDVKIYNVSYNSINCQSAAQATATTNVQSSSVVQSATQQPLGQNVVIHDPFGVATSNQNFVAVGNSSKLVYQPYSPNVGVNVANQVIINTSTFIVPAISVQPSAVNITFNAPTVSTTTPTIKMPHGILNEPVAINPCEKMVPVNMNQSQICDPSNKKSSHNAPVIVENTLLGVKIENYSAAWKAELERPTVIAKPDRTKKTKSQGQAKSKQNSAVKAKETLPEKIIPVSSTSKKDIKDPQRNAKKPEIVRSVKASSEKESFVDDKDADKKRIAMKRQAIINRQIHNYLDYPSIQLTYLPLAAGQAQTKRYEKGSSEVLEHSCAINSEKDLIENKDENEDSRVLKTGCRRILLRSSNKIADVANKDDKLGRKSAVRLKEPDYNDTKGLEVVDKVSVLEIKSVSEIVAKKSQKLIKNEITSNLTIDTKAEENEIRGKNEHIKASGLTPVRTRKSKRILNKKIKKCKTKEAKAEVLVPSENMFVTKHDAIVPDRDQILDIEAAISGVKINKTQNLIHNTLSVDDTLINSTEEIIESVESEKRTQSENKKPLTELTTEKKKRIIVAPVDMTNQNLDIIEILSSPEIDLTNVNPLTKMAYNLGDKNIVPSHSKNGTGSTLDEITAPKPLDVKEPEGVSVSNKTKSVDDVLKPPKDEIENTHAQSLLIENKKAIKMAAITENESSGDLFSCDVDIQNVELSTRPNKPDIKCVVVPTASPKLETILTRDEVLSVISPIGQKLSTNNKLTKLVDDIESALSIITETTVNSPIIDTLADYENNEAISEQKGIKDNTSSLSVITETSVSSPMIDTLTDYENSEAKSEQKVIKENSEIPITLPAVLLEDATKIDTATIDPRNLKKDTITESAPSISNSEDAIQPTAGEGKISEASLTSAEPSGNSIKFTSTTIFKRTEMVRNTKPVPLSEDSNIEIIAVPKESSAGKEIAPSLSKATYSNFIKSKSDDLQNKDTTAGKTIPDHHGVKNVDQPQSIQKETIDTVLLSDESEVESTPKQLNSITVVPEVVNSNNNLLTHNDIPQSYKDSIKIVEVPIPGNTNPYKRSVKITLPNNRHYKATVLGKVTIGFDSLFAEPTLKNILLSNLKNKKRYTLSIKPPSLEQPKTVEIVNLISDDEDEPDLPLQVLQTTTGSYKIRHIDNGMFMKHQDKLAQKCTVTMPRCDDRSEPESLVEALIKDLLPSSNAEETPSEVIEIDDSASEDELQRLPKIVELKDLLLKDLGVESTQNDDINENLQTVIPKVIVLENKRISRTRRSKYHRERDPITLIIPEKPSSSQTKRDKSVNSAQNKIDENEIDENEADENEADENEADENEIDEIEIGENEIDENEQRLDYSQIIKRKCYIELVRCDDMININDDNSSLEDNVTACNDVDGTDMTDVTFSRRGSLSLLNDLGTHVPITEITGPSIFGADSTPDVNINRSSPVMEIYDMIVSFTEKSSITRDIIADKCRSDWFHTKRYLHFVQSGAENIKDVLNKNDILTNSETDVSHSWSVSFSDSKIIYNETVSSLQSIMTKYFENNAIVNVLRPLCYKANSDVPKTPIKRKKTDQSNFISKVLKTSPQSVVNMRIRDCGYETLTQEIKETGASKVEGSAGTNEDSRVARLTDINETAAKKETDCCHIDNAHETVANIQQKSLSIADTQVIDTKSFFERDCITKEGGNISMPQITASIEILNDVLHSPVLGKNISKLTRESKNNDPKKTFSFHTENFDQSVEPDYYVVNCNSVLNEKEVQDDIVLESAMYESDVVNESTASVNKSPARTKIVLPLEIKQSPCDLVTCTIIDTTTSFLQASRTLFDSSVLEKISELTKSDEIPSILEAIDERPPIDNTTVNKTVESECNTAVTNGLLSAEAVETHIQETKTRTPAYNEQPTMLEAGNDKLQLPKPEGISSPIVFSAAEMVSTKSITPQTPSNIIDLDSFTKVIDQRKSNILDPTKPPSIIELPEVMLLSNIIGDTSHCTLKYPSILTAKDQGLYSEESVCSNTQVTDGSEIAIEPSVINYTSKDNETLIQAKDSTTILETSSDTLQYVNISVDQFNAKMNTNAYAEIEENTLNIPDAAKADNVSKNCNKPVNSNISINDSNQTTLKINISAEIIREVCQTNDSTFKDVVFKSNIEKSINIFENSSLTEHRFGECIQDNTTPTTFEPEENITSASHNNFESEVKVIKSNMFSQDMYMNTGETEASNLVYNHLNLATSKGTDQTESNGSANIEKSLEEHQPVDNTPTYNIKLKNVNEDNVNQSYLSIDIDSNDHNVQIPMPDLKLDVSSAHAEDNAKQKVLTIEMCINDSGKQIPSPHRKLNTTAEDVEDNFRQKVLPIKSDSKDHSVQIPMPDLKLDTSSKDAEDNVKQKDLPIEIDTNDHGVQMPMPDLKLDASSKDAEVNVKQKYLPIEINSNDHGVQIPMPDLELDTSSKDAEDNVKKKDLPIEIDSNDHGVQMPMLDVKLDVSIKDAEDKVKQKELPIEIDSNDHGVQIPMPDLKLDTSSEDAEDKVKKKDLPIEVDSKDHGVQMPMLDVKLDVSIKDAEDNVKQKELPIEIDSNDHGVQVPMPDLELDASSKDAEDNVKQKYLPIEIDTNSHGVQMAIPDLKLNVSIKDAEDNVKKIELPIEIDSNDHGVQMPMLDVKLDVSIKDAEDNVKQKELPIEINDHGVQVPMPDLELDASSKDAEDNVKQKDLPIEIDTNDHGVQMPMPDLKLDVSIKDAEDNVKKIELPIEINDHGVQVPMPDLELDASSKDAEDNVKQNDLPIEIDTNDHGVQMPMPDLKLDVSIKDAEDNVKKKDSPIEIDSNDHGVQMPMLDVKLDVSIKDAEDNVKQKELPIEINDHGVQIPMPDLELDASSKDTEDNVKQKDLPIKIDSNDHGVQMPMLDIKLDVSIKDAEDEVKQKELPIEIDSNDHGVQIPMPDLKLDTSSEDAEDKVKKKDLPIEVDSNDHGVQMPMLDVKLDVSIKDAEDNVKQKELPIEIDSNDHGVQVPMPDLELDASSKDAEDKVKQKYLPIEIDTNNHGVQMPMPDLKLDVSIKDAEDNVKKIELPIEINDHGVQVPMPDLELDASSKDAEDNVKQNDLPIEIDTNDHGVQMPMPDLKLDVSIKDAEDNVKKKDSPIEIDSNDHGVQMPMLDVKLDVSIKDAEDNVKQKELPIEINDHGVQISMPDLKLDASSEDAQDNVKQKDLPIETDSNVHGVQIPEPQIKLDASSEENVQNIAKYVKDISGLKCCTGIVNCSEKVILIKQSTSAVNEILEDNTEPYVYHESVPSCTIAFDRTEVNNRANKNIDYVHQEAVISKVLSKKSAVDVCSATIKNAAADILEASNDKLVQTDMLENNNKERTQNQHSQSPLSSSPDKLLLDSSKEMESGKLECVVEKAVTPDETFNDRLGVPIEPALSPGSTKSDECDSIIVEKSIREMECDENIFQKNATLVYKDDSGVILKGIEYEDPEIGTCYVFPLIQSSDNSETSDLLNESVNSSIEVIRNVNIETELQNPNSQEYETDVYDDEDLQVLIPKYTYLKRNLKRKSNMKEIILMKKRPRRNSKTKNTYNPFGFRKSKKLDAPKATSSEIADLSYSKEFQHLLEYYDNVGFSYSITYGREFIDVFELLEDWPIKGQFLDSINYDVENEIALYADSKNDTNTIEDPLELTFAEELAANYDDTNYISDGYVEETDVNVGFGEGSDRVIQNLDGGAISKFSAATLSDVKQSQPFLLSEKSDHTNMVKFYQSLRHKEQLDTLNRFYNYLKLKEKVRSFFKNTTIELTYLPKKVKDSVSNEDASSFPFHLYIPKIMEPRPIETVVQVVQVGQLPVSAAAQNPVTCDPRVTQVSNASPSQCSVDNSPHDPQQDTRTEYTELTTADLSLPLLTDGYVQHNQSLLADTQEGTNLALSTENIPIQTELLKSGMKFELAEENPDEKEKSLENCEQTDTNNHVNDVERFIYDSNNSSATVEAEIQTLFESKKQDVSETIPDTKPQNGSVEKTDQIAYAMNAAGITTTSETVTNRAQAFVNLLSQKIRQSTVVTTPNSLNNYPKTTTINAMSLQQALAQILPPPLNHTNSDNNQHSQNTVTPQVLHIVQGKGGSGNQITLVDNTQHSIINTPNATPVLHILQNKSLPGSTSNGSQAPQANTFSGISLVDAGMQQGGNQLLHIVNTGNQKNNNTTQLLKRVNLLTNLANVQGSNEQKMVQFICKSADGKSIQLNAPHQRSMVLRLQPIEPPNVQPVTQKPVEDQDSSPSPNVTVNTALTPNKTEIPNTQQEIKSRSVFEDNYAKFIQSSSNKSTVLEKLPKFNQAFGKSVYQDGTQKQHEINTNNLHPMNTGTENTDCPSTENSINLEHIGPMSSPPLLLRKSPQTTQPQANLVQQIKQAIAPMNLQTMHGGVIYTRQIPVNIGGGQTINLITVPNTEESGQKKQINQENMEPSIIKIVPQNHLQTSNAEGTSLNKENPQQNPPQPQPVLTQMRIKLPMLSKNPQMVSGTRLVRPSFFQIQRNIVGGANQQVYQQLVLTAAPPLGQQTIRLPQTQARQIKIPENQSPETQMSSSTLEQLREFDMVLEQVKERSTGQPNSNSNSSFKINNPSTDTTDSPPSATSASAAETTQVLYSIGSNQPINVAYVNRKSSVSTPTTSTYVRSPDSSGMADSPTSSSSQVQHQTDTTESSSSGTAGQPKVKISSRQRPRPKPHQQNAVKVTPPPKPSTQKPLEDEQTTQRILYILAEYKEQVENSPDKDKPAPRRRNNPPTNPSGSSKRKKSSSGSRRSGRDLSPTDDMSRMGSEDSSCGTSQGDCNESCMDSHSPQDSPRKVPRKLTFEPEPCSTPPPKPQPQRNVIVADGQTITVARGTAGKPTTAVLMPANYILPVSMVKGGQQIAIVTNRGPKLLTVGGGEGGGTNTLLLQRLIGPAGLKPVLTRPGVRQVRLPTAALHNLQAFNIASSSTTQPPDSTASPGAGRNPPDLVETNRNETSSWAERSGNKPNRASSPEETEPWNLPSSADPNDYSYEETVRAEHMDRTVLDHMQDRYSPDMEAQRIFDKMFDVEAKKSYNVDSVDSPRCGYDIDASDCDDKPYQVVHKKDATSRQGRFAHVSAAALRHKYAILEHELRLQKSLSEECEDLGVDSPSASELFPEAELLFAASPAQDHASDVPQHSHTPQPTILNQTLIQPDIDDQIATDHILQRNTANERQDLDVNLGLEDVGIVTVSEDGTQATIALDHEEFARSHPNTTFHSEPTDEGEVQPFTIAGLKTRHITSTIFHSNRAPATVLMTAPQTTVISQATAADHTQQSVKYSDIDNMINSIPSTHTNNINLSTVLVKEDGLTRYDNILTDSRELHLSNTASAIVHSGGNTTQVIRRVCHDDSKRTRDNFLMDESDAIIAGDDAKMVAEDSSRDATLGSMGGDADDDNSSPGRHAELFWESNSASERSEGRRPLDFSSDSEKCCKSPTYEENNSTDSSGVGAHMRLDSVIKDARGIDRSASADGSSADDNHPPLRTYPAKRLYHTADNDLERSLSGKTRAGERSPDLEVRRRASGRGVVKRGCHCCNGSPAPSRPKKPRQRKPAMDFTN